MDGIGKGAERLRSPRLRESVSEDEAGPPYSELPSQETVMRPDLRETGLDLRVGHGMGHRKAARDEPAKTQV